MSVISWSFGHLAVVSFQLTPSRLSYCSNCKSMMSCKGQLFKPVIELGAFGLQFQHSNHSATVPLNPLWFSFIRLKDATRQADRMTKSHKSAADSFIRISSCISQMGTSEYMDIDRFLNKVFWLFYFFHLLWESIMVGKKKFLWKHYFVSEG